MLSQLEPDANNSNEEGNIPRSSSDESFARSAEDNDTSPKPQTLMAAVHTRPQQLNQVFGGGAAQVIRHNSRNYEINSVRSQQTSQHNFQRSAQLFSLA